MFEVCVAGYLLSETVRRTVRNAFNTAHCQTCPIKEPDHVAASDLAGVVLVSKKRYSVTVVRVNGRARNCISVRDPFSETRSRRRVTFLRFSWLSLRRQTRQKKRVGDNEKNQIAWPLLELRSKRIPSINNNES